MKTAAAPVIAAAAPADAAAIDALLRAADLPADDFADHLAHFLVARRGDAVVGAVGLELHGRDALLRSLVVAPGERGGVPAAIAATREFQSLCPVSAVCMTRPVAAPKP